MKLATTVITFTLVCAALVGCAATEPETVTPSNRDRITDLVRPNQDSLPGSFKLADEKLAREDGTEYSAYVLKKPTGSDEMNRRAAELFMLGVLNAPNLASHMSRQEAAEKALNLVVDEPSLNFSGELKGRFGQGMKTGQEQEGDWRGMELLSDPLDVAGLPDLLGMEYQVADPRISRGSLTVNSSGDATLATVDGTAPPPSAEYWRATMTVTYDLESYNPKSVSTYVPREMGDDKYEMTVTYDAFFIMDRGMMLYHQIHSPKLLTPSEAKQAYRDTLTFRPYFESSKTS